MVVLGVAITAAAFFALRPREPVYQGKSVTQWISELPKGQRLTAMGFIDHETPAKEAIRSIGTNAVPYLAQAINRHDSRFANWRVEIWFRWPFLQRHFSRPSYPLEIRREAARTLQEFVSRYPKASFDEIVPALARAMRDPDSDLRVVAVSTLGLIAVKHQSQRALAALVEALDSPHEEVRRFATGKLAEGNQAQSQALPSVLGRFSDPSVGVRLEAALAVWRIGQQTNDAVTVLVSALGANSPTDRGNAANHLSLIGPAAKQAIPVLEQKLNDPDQYVRQWASIALQKIDPENHPEAKPTLQSLIEQLKNADGNRRMSAALALKEMGAVAKAAVPALVETLQTPSVQTRLPGNRWAVAQALWAIDPGQTSVIVPAMANELADPTAWNRHMAALVLAEMGPEARDAASALFSGLTDQDPHVRLYCAYALLRIGVYDEATKHQAVQILVDGLQPKRNIRDRQTAARLLGKLGPTANEAVPALTEVLNGNDDAELSKLAREALSKIGPSADDTIPAK